MPTTLRAAMMPSMPRRVRNTIQFRGDGDDQAGSGAACRINDTLIHLPGRGASWRSLGRSTASKAAIFNSQRRQTCDHFRQFIAARESGRIDWTAPTASPSGAVAQGGDGVGAEHHRVSKSFPIWTPLLQKALPTFPEMGGAFLGHRFLPKSLDSDQIT